MSRTTWNRYLDGVAGTHSLDGLGDLFGTAANLRPIRGQQYDKPNSPAGQILLVGQALVSRYQNLVFAALCEIEQLAVALLGPTLLRQRVHRVSGQMSPQWRGRALVEQQLQRANAVLSVFASCSSTARTCRSSTPGNHSTNSPTVAPPARFS